MILTILINPDAPTNVMLDISVSDLVFGAEGGENLPFIVILIGLSQTKVNGVKRL